MDSSSPLSDYDIYIMKIDDTEKQTLTNDGQVSDDFAPSLGPASLTENHNAITRPRPGSSLAGLPGCSWIRSPIYNRHFRTTQEKDTAH